MSGQDVTRRPDGEAETAADTRFFDLRESGYTGPVDQDGRKAAGSRAGQVVAAMRGKSK
jgi:hypothetical protein